MSATAQQTHDVCVVGSGPVGMAVALRCRQAGLSVLLLDAGGETPRGGPLAPVCLANAYHAEPAFSSCVAFGGTSWWWGGRCVSFDPVDFEPRPELHSAKWPVTWDELQPWLREAAPFFGCSDTLVPAPTGAGEVVRTDTVEGWAPDPQLARRYAAVLRDLGVEIRLHHKVVGFDWREGRVTALTAEAQAGRVQIAARRFVIACGGIETVRLLLAAQRRSPGLFGGPDGALGRYYMGHISGKIAYLCLADPAAIEEFDFQPRAPGFYHRKRFTFTPRVLRDERLPNIALWPDNPPFYDPAHRSGALSVVFLALLIPPVGRRLLAEAVRLAHTGGRPQGLLRHFGNILRQPLRTARDLLSILEQRLGSRPRRPGFLVRSPQGRYALHYHAEHLPSASSRIRLLASTAETTLPAIEIDFRYLQADAEKVVRSHRVLDHWLRETGVGRLEFIAPEDDLVEVAMRQATDGFHQIGATRMGDDPRTSIVDGECRVHDFENLYIASSSIFPTSGQANPTLLAVALGMRLSAHLAALAVATHHDRAPALRGALS